MHKYSRVRITTDNLVYFKYRVEGYNGVNWEPREYSNWLWRAKMKANNLLKEKSTKRVVYEVSR